MNPTGAGLGRAMLIGAASGLRSQIGLAALSVGPAAATLPRPLDRTGARRSAVLGAAGELVVDKLPRTPNRLDPGPLASRAVSGAVTGGLVVRRRGGPVLLGAVIGAVSAVVAARAGHDARAALAQRAPALAVAVGEDCVAVGLAYAAVRP